MYRIDKTTKFGMPQFFSNIAKVGLWVLVPTLFISGTKLDDRPSSAMLAEGEYIMEVSGNLNDNISGVINFETAVETTSRGISFSTLKLKLDNKRGTLPHSVEFLISVENYNDLLPVGKYKVARNQKGFLNYFNGVFGFANINALGELPLFAKRGVIEIERLDHFTVKGKLNVTMSNTMGKSVQIQGDFIASK